MKTKRFLSYLPVFLIALAPLAWHGCGSTAPKLDPVGGYASDALLWQLDGVIDSWTATCVAVRDWADRNPAYVAAHPNIAEQVAKIRAEIDGAPQDNETLERLHDIRDAYVITRTATPQDVRAEMALARTVIETARLLLNASP